MEYYKAIFTRSKKLNVVITIINKKLNPTVICTI